MRNELIDIKVEDLENIMYFILSMFDESEVHLQGTSSKGDLLGGYIDRWVNKIAEEVTFNELLLKNKNYKAVVDYFIYNSNNAKNNSDILGITNGSDLIKFTNFNYDKWEQIDGMPFIEVKTFRKSHKLCSIRIPQWDESHYYVFAETNFKNDYLKSYFKSEVFSDDIYENIHMEDEFIIDNSKNIIKQPKKISPYEGYIGTMNLIGIFSGKQLKDYCTLCNSGISPKYIYDIKELDPSHRVRGKYDIPIKIDEIEKPGKFISYVDGILKIENCVDMLVTNKDAIEVLKENLRSIYIKCNSNCKINQFELKEGSTYVIYFQTFDRSSSWDELVGYKEVFRSLQDSTNSLIEELDKIAESFEER